MLHPIEHNPHSHWKSRIFLHSMGLSPFLKIFLTVPLCFPAWVFWTYPLNPGFFCFVINPIHEQYYRQHHAKYRTSMSHTRCVYRLDNTITWAVSSLTKIDISDAKRYETTYCSQLWRCIGLLWPLVHIKIISLPHIFTCAKSINVLNKFIVKYLVISRQAMSDKTSSFDNIWMLSNLTHWFLVGFVSPTGKPEQWWNRPNTRQYVIKNEFFSNVSFLATRAILRFICLGNKVTFLIK